MKQCTTCGAFGDDNAKFCTACGSQFSQADAPVQAERAAGSPVYPSYPDASAYAPYAPKVTTKKEFVELPENQAFKKENKTCGIICYVCAGLTLLVGVIGGTWLSLIDFVILLVLGLFIHLKQSKVCAILLLIYSIINVIIGLIAYGKFQGYLILIAGVYAVINAFKLDKAWKEYRAK